MRHPASYLGDRQMRQVGLLRIMQKVPGNTMVNQDVSELAGLARRHRSSGSDNSSDAVLDDIAYVAARALDCPIAVVGLGRLQDDGLCGVAVMRDDPWVLDNPAIDPRTLINPLAAGAAGLHFYVGVPLITSEGHKLGMLAIADRDPRAISEGDLTLLKKLAGLAVHFLETRLELRVALHARKSPLTSVA